MLRAVSAAARWSLRLLGVAWITLLLVWGGLHFLIVPRIGELRPWLEQQASGMLGAKVVIGNIIARSNGLIPSIELVDVRLMDGQGREALLLPSVVAALSPRSAVSLGFEQIYIHAPSLDVRRTRDGSLWIAGFEIPESTRSDSPAADWVLSQSELVVRHGTVRWTDELRGVPAVELSDVDVVVRKRLRTHSIRVDANPPAAWGTRLSVSGIFRQPLLARNASNWRQWQGQAFAQSDRLDVAQLRKYLDLGVNVAQGTGAVRAWVEVVRGEVTSATADVALADVNVKVDPRLEPITMTSVSGRLGAKQLDGGYEFFTEALAFSTADGLHWPGGNVRVALFGAEGRNPARSEISGDQLDLASMALIARRLPIDDAARSALAAYAPKGLLERVQASWQGDLAKAERFTAKGRVVELGISAQALPAASPGVTGATLDFDMNQVGGKATVAMQGGAIELPGIFDEPVIALDQLAGDIQWKIDGEHIQLSMPGLRFGNSDMQGELQLKWQTANAPAGGVTQHARFPGVLDLQGSLSRADITKVHRYLPIAIDKEVRDYFRDALTAGVANNVKFTVKGDLRTFPYDDAKQGALRISADIKNASYAFAPASLLPKDSLPWPALSQLSGDLVLEHDTLRIKSARSQWGGPNIQLGKLDAQVNNLYGGATVSVTAEGKGPLNDMLGLVNGSPLGAMTGKALARATATAAADLRLRLAFPIAAVDRATVQGSLLLPGNDVQLSPETPRLTRLRGTIGFTENGFSVSGGQARALGGDVRIDGGMSTLPATAARPTPVLRIQGTATAEGLRQAKELGFASRLAQYAGGASAYSAVLGLRSGVPELLITSSLTGLSLNLPAPFAKAPDVALPLRLETSLVRASLLPGAKLQDQLQLDIGRLANMVYVRDVSGTDARVLRGSIGVGLAADESAPLPDAGVVANINIPLADVDAWVAILKEVSGPDAPVTSASGAPGTAGASGTAGAASVAGMAYLPTQMAVRSRELTLGGRKLNNVVVGGSREGTLWRANLDAAELNGYLEYRQPSGTSAGRVVARLARLVIGQSTAQDVESLLDDQPTSIPALDIVVEDLELRGKKLGRVEVDAVNLASTSSANIADAPREWRLNRFNITTPEAVLTAGGNWTALANQPVPVKGRSIKERRRTVLNFKLDIADSGDVLARLGMPGLVRRGKGKIEGQVAWLGSPLTLDYPSLGGSFNINVENGQFLKADPGIAKLLGVLSLQSLPRRLTLDFRDVFSEGFSFDFVRGDVTIEQGIARTNNLQMKGVNAAALMEGQADIAKETQLLKVVVIPEINAGSASLITAVINPLVGLTTFLAQVILRRPLIDAATQEFQIDGTWVDPRVTRVDRK